jgi:transposase InsO family protein
MLERYVQYGWTKASICRKWETSLQAFCSLKRCPPKTDRPRRTRLNKITQEEEKKVIEYAIKHPKLKHREMAYKMIDEDIVYLSPSSVYRILKKNNLLERRESKKQHKKWNAHAPVSEPDDKWQTDLMVVPYKSRDYYLLSYLDVRSRFIVYNELCLSMTGDSINQASERAIKYTEKKPKVIQSDNGSCYISSEYRSFIDRNGIEHHRIHAHCPNENAEIERYHRSLWETLDPSEAENFETLIEIVKEQIRYYNYERYHSAIGFITPYAMYSGQAEAIFESRKKKLQNAKEQRIKINIERSKNTNQLQQPKAA